jgi:hypothetical protein
MYFLYCALDKIGGIMHLARNKFMIITEKLTLCHDMMGKSSSPIIFKTRSSQSLMSPAVGARLIAFPNPIYPNIKSLPFPVSSSPFFSSPPCSVFHAAGPCRLPTLPSR